MKYEKYSGNNNYDEDNNTIFSHFTPPYFF